MQTYMFTHVVHDDVPPGTKQLDFPHVMCLICLTHIEQYDEQVDECPACGSPDLLFYDGPIRHDSYRLKETVDDSLS